MSWLSLRFFLQAPVTIYSLFYVFLHPSCLQAIYLDVSQIGITWTSLYLGDFPLVAPLIMLAVDAVLYFFLAVWLDNVIPGKIVYIELKTVTQVNLESIILIHIVRSKCIYDYLLPDIGTITPN